MFKVSGIWVSRRSRWNRRWSSTRRCWKRRWWRGRTRKDLVKPAAFVVLKDGRRGADEAEALKDFVKDKIGMWKYPRWIEVVDDLPKTATGKIQRFKLREHELMADWAAAACSRRAASGWNTPAAGRRPDAAPTLVLLHEGLGCVALWRDFPARLAAATGLRRVRLFARRLRPVRPAPSCRARSTT